MINVYLCSQSENGTRPKIIPFIKQRVGTPAHDAPLYKSLSAWKRAHQPQITTLVFSFQNQHAQMSTSRKNPAGITVHGEMHLLLTCDLKRDKACERMNVHQYIRLQRRPVLLVSKMFAREGSEFTSMCAHFPAQRLRKAWSTPFPGRTGFAFHFLARISMSAMGKLWRRRQELHTQYFPVHFLLTTCAATSSLRLSSTPLSVPSL